MPMRKDKLVRDYFGDQLFITTSGHFSTPALHCAMGEVGVQSIMFSIDYPFESIPNACGKSIFLFIGDLFSYISLPSLLSSRH